ncbi:MAG: ABC transporter permease [Bacteroidaceae bacterium]|nr:ABC transporter permease [Bacteroidaceae bacterium]
MKIFGKKQSSFIKILSISIGLTIGIVLIAKVQWMEDYDSYIEDGDNVYSIFSHNHIKDQEYEYDATPGGYAPTIQKYHPEIVAATRIGRYSNPFIELNYNERLKIDGFACFTDTSFFKVFNRKIIAGNPTKCLNQQGMVMISEEMAKKIGGNVIGKNIKYNGNHKSLTIAGIYEGFPENSTLHDTHILISMPSMGLFNWDGSMNMVGNDAYRSFLRVSDNIDVKRLEKNINKTLHRVLPMKQLKDLGYKDIGCKLVKAKEAYRTDSQNRAVKNIYLTVAIILIVASVMNYILIVVSSLVGMVKKIAVLKCCGANKGYFYMMSMRSSCLHIILSIIISIITIFAGQELIKQVLGASFSVLFSNNALKVIICICTTIILICGMVPGFIYSHISTQYAFKQFKENKKTWKLSLLAFQILMTSTLFCLVLVISRQYNHLVNKDLGYDYNNVVYIEGINMLSKENKAISEEIKKLSFVEEAGCTTFILNQASCGNHAYLPDNDEMLFSYNELLYMESSALKAYKIDVIRGELFSQTEDSIGTEVMIDEQFESKLKNITGWDNVIGKELSIRSDYNSTIVGVYRNMYLNSLLEPDTRPSLVTNGWTWSTGIIARLNNMNKSNFEVLHSIMNNMYPNRDFTITPIAEIIRKDYNKIENDRTLIVIGCLSTLFITIIGLIGYIRDEVQRRSRELAIRKVLGSKLKDIQLLFIRNISKIAIPSLIAGICIGTYLSNLLLISFPERISLTWDIYAITILLILSIIFGIILLLTYKVANSNPTEYLKTE